MLIDHYRGSKAYIHRSLDCQKQGPCVLSQKLELLVNVNSWHIYNCFEGKKFQMRNWKYFKWEIENISNSMFIKSCTQRVKVKGHLLTWRHLLQYDVFILLFASPQCASLYSDFLVFSTDIASMNGSHSISNTISHRPAFCSFTTRTMDCTLFVISKVQIYF